MIKTIISKEKLVFLNQGWKNYDKSLQIKDNYYLKLALPFKG